MNEFKQYCDLLYINPSLAGGSRHVYAEMMTPTTTTLVINNLSANDAGTYACVLGTVRAQLTIQVNSKCFKNGHQFSSGPDKKLDGVYNGECVFYA